MKIYPLLVALCLSITAVFAYDEQVEAEKLIFRETVTKTPFLRSWTSIEYGEILDLINTLHSSLHTLNYPDTRANIYYYSHQKTVNSLYQKYDLISSFILPSHFYNHADYTLIVDQLKLRAYGEFLFKDLLSFLFTKYPLDYSKECWKELLLELSGLYKVTDHTNYQETSLCKKKCLTLLISFITKLPANVLDAWVSIIKRLNDKDQLDIIPQEVETFDEVKDTTMQILVQPVFKEDIFDMGY